MWHRLHYIPEIALALCVAGWAAIIFTATFLGGGHPPLSAYVGVAVLLGIIVIAPAGLIFQCFRQSRHAAVGSLVFLGNSAFLLHSVWYLFLRR